MVNLRTDTTANFSDESDDSAKYNRKVTVINNSSKKLIVLDAYTEDGDGVLFDYHERLRVVPFDSGKKFLANGEQDTVTLCRMVTHTNSVTHKTRTFPSPRFTLILADPCTLFPIKQQFEKINDDVPKPYPYTTNPITVTDEDAKLAAKAIQFIQQISAYPTSKMAKAFAETLKSSTDSSPDEKDEAFLKFFKGTKDFTELTWDLYLLASTYMTAFASNWVPPQTHVPYNSDRIVPAHDTYSYWLYSPANMGGDTSTGGRGQASPATCFGVVAFKDHKNSFPMDTTDSQSGWTIVFSKDGFAKDGGGNTTPLYFKYGQFADQQSDISNIALQGCWALKSIFTGDPTDFAMSPALVGKVGNTQVIGVPIRPQDRWDKDAQRYKKFFGNFFQNLTLKSLIHIFMLGVGLWMAVDFLTQKIGGKSKRTKDVKDLENDGKDLTPEQEAAVKARGLVDDARAKALLEKQARELGEDPVTEEPVQIPDETALPQAQETAKAAQIKCTNEITGDGLKAAGKEVQNDLDTLDYCNDPDLEDAQDSLDSCNENLADAVSSGKFEGVKADLTDAQTTVKGAVTDIDNNIAKETQAEVKASQEFQDVLKEASEAAEKEGDAVEEGETPDAEGYEAEIFDL